MLQYLQQLSWKGFKYPNVTASRDLLVVGSGRSRLPLSESLVNGSCWRSDLGCVWAPDAAEADDEVGKDSVGASASEEGDVVTIRLRWKRCCPSFSMDGGGAVGVYRRQEAVK